ncbi:MAG: hypothetical protein ABSD49_10390 [Candidatus Bathyarchaeia archaeon]|jgi:hypothetical protein
MNSATLNDLGFHSWRRFTVGVETHAPSTVGVYAFRSPTAIILVKDSSDIMYIGRAMGVVHNLRHALELYLRPGPSQRTKIRVGRKALEEAWEVSWMENDFPADAECKLLKRFHSDHGQLPPENKMWPENCYP